MTLEEIRKMPKDRTFSAESAANGLHESVFRSYHIVEKIKELLEAETPARVVLQIIDDLQNCKGDRW